MQSQNSEMVRFMYDAYMFKNLPFCTPIVTSAVSLSCFFVCLHFGGWLYGTIGYVPIKLLGESLDQSYITTGASRGPCGMAWGVIGSAVVSYFVQLRNSL